jgi:hypothetical protein
MDMKSSRLCMFAASDRNKGQWISLEKLKFAHKLNHFALKTRICLAASKAVWIELYNIKYAMGA